VPLGNDDDRENERDETETQRLDRNWASLLQELRVVQTGVQVLTGFLLTLPFQDRFSTLDDVMQGVYLATVVCSIGSTVLLVAPVGMHRLLFRRHQLTDLVAASHRFALAGIVLLGLALTGVVALVFYMVLNGVAAGVAAGLAAVLFVYVWWIVPVRRRA
jgi:O-antigen/teichoic acid export membrane protein